MKIKLSKIKYDVDSPEEAKGLPKSMTVEIDDDEYECAKEDPDDLDELLGDIITDNTDFCVLSFDYEELSK